MNNKFSIGVVVAIVLQVSGFVWWIAQQSQTIEQLNSQVTELTSRMAVEKEVTLINDVKQLRKELDDLREKTLESLLEIDGLRKSEDNRLGGHIDERVDGLGTYIDGRLQDITNNIIAEFEKHEGWIDDIDADINVLHGALDYEIQQLDKKLSDRIKNHDHAE